MITRSWGIIYNLGIGVLGLLLLMHCSEDKSLDNETSKEYDVGKNRFTLTINGDIREYFVHVPKSYADKDPIPVVFMLHGSSGNGEKFYNISGWKELGETENILTVYPSSWEYCINTVGGGTKRTTKWNRLEDDASYCTDENPRDDIKFLRQIVEQLESKFNVDEKGMYLVGFSNGGDMALNCAIEMSDVFAAIVETARATSIKAIHVPKRPLPITYQIGNADDSNLPPLPMDALDSLLTTSPFQETVQTHINTFGFNSVYTVSGDPNVAVTATYPGPTGSYIEFKVVLIKNLQHEYPNGTNHLMKGAEVNWEWMKQYTLN